MNIFITGGTGFIGSHLIDRLLGQGHRLTVISRSKRPSSRSGLTFITGDVKQPGGWQEVLAEHEAVINLAGSSIFKPWSEKNKQIIKASRLETTSRICEALARDDCRVKVLLNASAVGYYGDRGDEQVDESTGPGADFLAEIAINWEREARQAEAYGVRVVFCRFGIVLGKDGGAVAMMKPVFKLGLGSQLGSGSQWFPWVHVDDLTAILSFLLEREDISGPVNCTAPGVVTNKEMTERLAKVLHRPTILPAVPAFALKMIAGEAATMLLSGQKAVPRVLQEHGFTFTYPDLSSALQQVTS